jgi:hypothetical protein
VNAARVRTELLKRFSVLFSARRQTTSVFPHNNTHMARVIFCNFVACGQNCQNSEITFSRFRARIWLKTSFTVDSFLGIRRRSLDHYQKIRQFFFSNCHFTIFVLLIKKNLGPSLKKIVHQKLGRRFFPLSRHCIV